MTEAPEKLLAHTREFTKEVVIVGEKIHVAVGFALSNTILIEGELEHESL